MSQHEFDIDITSPTVHVIDIGSQKPIKQPLRRVPTAFAEEKEEKVIKQLEDQFII